MRAFDKLFASAVRRRIRLPLNAASAALVLAAAMAAAQEPAPAAPSASPAQASSDPAFDILEFDVEGNSVLSQREIERAVYPFLGEKRHFADVEAARKALEDLYQKRDYQTVFVDIPEQKVSGGVIRLHVLEGRVGSTRVSGARYFDQGRIRAGADQMAPGSVPEFHELQQQLAQLNKMPDRQVNPILTPGKVPGTVDVDLSVKDQLPLHADIEVDNHASPYTTALRTSASFHYDNLWQRQHSFALNYQLAPEAAHETNVLYGTYLWRFAGSDQAVSVYGVRSNSNIAVLGSSTVLGKAKIYGARWIVPLGSGESRGATFFNSLTLGIDRKSFAQTNIDALTQLPDILPAIDYSPLSGSFALTLLSPGTQFQLTLGAVTAPRGLLGNSDDAFKGRRVTGGASWVAWKYDASVEQWFGRHFSGYARLEGQWSSDPLIPNEQFITGGADSVRGYKESEVSGDHGYHATLEARYYPLGRPGADGQRTLYTLIFVDGAEVGLVDPLGPQVSTLSLESAGLGLRLQNWYGFKLAVDFAHTLREGGHAATGPAVTPGGANRIGASLDYGF